MEITPNTYDPTLEWGDEVRCLPNYFTKHTTITWNDICLLYTSPSPRDYAASRMPSSA